MKSSLNQMDLEEDWELLPDDGFLEIHDDGGKKIYSRKHYHDPSRGSSNNNKSSSAFHMNYFILPSISTTTTTKVPDQLVSVPFDIQHTVLESQKHEVVKKDQIPVEIIEKIKPFEVGADDQEEDPAVSQVFFKKETEFVDMKVESPRSNSSTTHRGIMMTTEKGVVDHYKVDSETESNMELDSETESHVESESNNDNIWKWSFLSGGIGGAICSIGVAAATVCIIVFSSHQKNRHPRRNQKLQYQIYTTSDKRMKQVVVQHANRLNEAISAARGAAITRARITVGGYYDASSSSASSL